MTKSPPKIDIDQLKGIIKITELAERLGIELNRSHKALCVFHSEQTPSLSFNDERGIFKCFSCGKGGDIIDLYKGVKGIETGGAIKELAEMAGLLPATHQTHTSHARSDFKAINSQTHQKPATHENKGDYHKVYEELYFLTAGLDAESEAYLKGETRGLTDETITRFLLCSVKDYPKLNQALKDKFKLEDLQRAGLYNAKGNLVFWRHKILIPFLKDGRIVYVLGRQVGNQYPDAPKTLNLTGITPPAFNTDTLKGMRKGERVYICEGAFDAMILEQNGHHAIAILGVNSFKPELTHQFKGFEVVLALDNDEAGERATKELAKMFLLNGQKVKRQPLIDGVKDITDYFIKRKTL